jgi:type VI protein secretion system component Hcp
MAIDAFLEFTKPGIAGEVSGESQDSKLGQSHKPFPCFELISWDFGTSNAASISSATMGAGSGKATFAEFHIQKTIDFGTASLFQTLCSGGHYPELTLWIRKTGGAQGSSGEPYLEWKFAMAFVKEIAWSHADPAPTEDVKFVYGAMRFSYRRQKSSGGLDKEVPSQWSQVLNADQYSVPAD